MNLSREVSQNIDSVGHVIFGRLQIIMSRGDTELIQLPIPKIIELKNETNPQLSHTTDIQGNRDLKFGL